MASFFAIYNRRENGCDQPAEATFGSAKLLPEKQSAPLSTGQVEDAKVVFLEAATLAEAQSAVRHFFPGNITGTPVIVTAAQFKES